VPSEQPPVATDSAIGLSFIDICTAADNDGDSYFDSRLFENSPEQIEQYKGMRRNIKDRLVVSPTSEHLHLAALLESEPVARIELIKKALSQNPDDAYLLWDAVHICAEELGKTECPIREWEHRLLAIDGQNSESWMRVAANRYYAGEVGAALWAMRRAATAAESRVYWTESIEMIERGLAAGSNFSFVERASAAFGIAASNSPDYRAFVNMCKDRSNESVDWAYVCLAYGELAEYQGKTDMGQSIARAIQRFALEAIGNEEELAAVLERQDTARQDRLESAPVNYPMAEKLLLSSPSVFSAYLAVVRSRGEIGARAYLRDEIEQLLHQHEDRDCPQ